MFSQWEDLVDAVYYFNGGVFLLSSNFIYVPSKSLVVGDDDVVIICIGKGSSSTPCIVPTEFHPLEIFGGSAQITFIGFSMVGGVDVRVVDHRKDRGDIVFGDSQNTVFLVKRRESFSDWARGK